MKQGDTRLRPAPAPGESIAHDNATAPLRLVAQAVDAPAFVLPFLDRFYEPAETALVAALANGPLGVTALRGLVAPNAARGEVRAFLERAHRRGVLERAARGRYSAASFHDRFVVWTFFEGWLDLPDSVRDRLREWELSFYVDQARPYVEAVKAGLPIDPIENHTFLLLDEVEEILLAQENVYLFPCDCRAILGRCRKPTLNCLRFEGAHGHWHDLGWEISPQRAIENAREADRQGLMHTGGLPGGPMRGICTCCADCCFPQLAGERLDAAKLWPLSRYVARVEAASCDGCNRCAPRCPFGAIIRSAGPANGELVVPALDAALCRGCGLCATGCPSAAIVMDRL
ncbi:MAG: 4Fe-4S dicluster domain-containing protein [Thermoleophilia bacterium]